MISKFLQSFFWYFLPINQNNFWNNIQISSKLANKICARPKSACFYCLLLSIINYGFKQNKFWSCHISFLKVLFVFCETSCTGCYVISVVEEGWSTRPVGQCMYPWKTLVWVAQLNEILFDGAFIYSCDFTRYREDRQWCVFLLFPGWLGQNLTFPDLCLLIWWHLLKVS